MIKTPLSTVIGGAFWTPGATVISGNTSTFDQQIQKLFANNEQGFFYDPNDLTPVKQNWRKNMLTWTEDFTKWVNGFTATPSDGGWLLEATTTGLPNISLQYPIGVSVTTGTIVRSIELKKGTADFVRVGAGSDGGAITIDLRTLSVVRNARNHPYTIQVLEDGWFRFEFFQYSTSFGAALVSNTLTWGMTFGGVGIDGEGQVGSTIYARKPSYAYIQGVQSNESIPYQAITDFTSDFLNAFPDHTLFQDAAGTVPVTAVGQPVGLIRDKSGRNNHARQATSAARPLMQSAPLRLDFDAVDDKLITNLPTQLTGCTVVRFVPNVGTQILTSQTIPATYNDNTDHCGLIVINRALTATETSQITKLFDKAAGV